MVLRRAQLGVVQYESNVLGTRGPRRMQVGLPKVLEDSRPVRYYTRGERLYRSFRVCVEQATFQPRSSRDSMMSKFKKREFRNLLIAYNKPPRWNDEVGFSVRARACV
jgi:tubby-related protein 1